MSCGEQALEIVTGQTDNGLYVQGTQLAQSLGLVAGALITSAPVVAIKRRTRVLILGVNGFIGNHLTERLLKDDNYEIYGLDIGSDAISRFLNNPRFHFVEGDISIHSEWIEYHIKNATWCCRWSPSPRQSSTPVTRCACSSWISKRT